MQSQYPALNWPTLPDFSLPTAQLPAFTFPDLLQTLNLAFPDLTWPSIDLPEFAGVSLPQLGLAVPSMHFGIPSLSMPLASLPNFNLPTFRLPAIDVDLPDLGSGVAIDLPNIPVPSLDFPVIDFSQYDLNDWMPIVGGLACAFLIDILDDFKDFVLIFGKSSLLAKKALARKQRMRAAETLKGAVGEEEEEEAAAAPSASRSNKVAPA